jgi:hypothetical protein
LYVLAIDYKETQKLLFRVENDKEHNDKRIKELNDEIVITNNSVCEYEEMIKTINLKRTTLDTKEQSNPTAEQSNHTASDLLTERAKINEELANAQASLIAEKEKHTSLISEQSSLEQKNIALQTKITQYTQKLDNEQCVAIRDGVAKIKDNINTPKIFLEDPTRSKENELLFIGPIDGKLEAPLNNKLDSKD